MNWRGDYGVHDWIRRANEQIPHLEEQRRRHTQKSHELERLIDGLEREVPERFEGLVVDLLPDLTPASIQRAAKTTGALSEADPAGMVHERRADLERELAEIRAETDLEALETRVTGALPAAIGELKENLRPLRTFLRQAKHERLDHLLDVGYGTETYAVPWWRMTYYSDWKAGDEILEQTREEFQDFASFRDAFAQRFNEATVLEGELDRLTQEQVAGVGTLERVRELMNAHENAEAEVLEELRDTLRSLLEARGDGAFEGRDHHPEAKITALGWVGTGKRLQYARELQREWLVPFGAAINKDLEKMKRKRSKYRRPKKARTRFTKEEIERTFADKTPKWEKFWSRYDAAFAALNDFDGRYQYGRFDDDFLWWDLFCDGRVRARFSEEYVEFYEEHEDYSWTSPWDDEDDYAWEESQAAAAVVEADGYDDGELWDGS